MQIEFHSVNLPFVTPFRIAYRAQTYSEAVQVRISDRSFVGRGEALGVSYHGETVDSMLAQLTSLADKVGPGISRADLQHLLPPGGARNAVDCALWDLESKQAERRAWELAGIHPVTPLVTAYTIGLDTPELMAKAAAAARQYLLLKLKLDGTCDLERVAAVRSARPDVRLIVDANQSWNGQHLHGLIPKMAKLGVELIEQPLPEGADDMLADFKSAVPLCADESCQTRLSLPSVVGKYQFINIKLDKTGGLTEALALAREAESRDIKLMVGCMAGSSLSMAPAFIIGQLCSFVDLDGPLLSSVDVQFPILYQGSQMHPPEVALWG
jgi:L-alanine-DL-glutamate epimerase-like enolase superfamily enzyme